ncbi:MAG TPA: alpha/beta hydrolase [Allosphingosinicella sp.]|jgi:acetyl esterase/lipase
MRLSLVPLAAAVAIALAGCSVTEPPAPPAPAAPLMTWPDLMQRQRPEPDATLAYGEDRMQKVDVWLPAGAGRRPVVLMVHGGCWQSEVADRRIMNWIADDLRKRGIAVWNIDYRGVDRAGGGYPGTFLDAAAAADALMAHAAEYRLDISRLVAVGHSAGGHLALWLAGRRNLPAGSPLRAGTPIAIRKVVSLGGLPDLEEAARPPGSGCGTDVIGQISGGGKWAETSVPRLAPLGVRQVLVNGLQDRIIPAHYAGDYAAAMRARGDKVEVRMIERTGHVELIAPESAAWAMAVGEIEDGLRP